MKKQKKIVLVAVLILCKSFTSLNAQDIHFSQFWMAPQLQNPALAGAIHDLQAIVNYKNQWGSVASPYKTFAGSFDMRLNKKKHQKEFFAGGINIFSDKAGDSQMGTTQGSLNLAYHVFISDNSALGAGLMGGFAQRSINYSELQWMSQYSGSSYDPSLYSGEPSGLISLTYPDLAAGLVWTYRQGASNMTGNDQTYANAGIAVFHPHQPRYSFYDSDEKLYMKIVAHGNVLCGIPGTNLSVEPGFVYYLQGSAKELIIGSIFHYALEENSRYTGFNKAVSFSFGVHYRNNDAVIASVLFQKAEYAAGISYDINTSGLKTASNGQGGIELSLRFIPIPIVKSKSRYY